MRVDRFRNKEGNEFFVVEIHRLPSEEEPYEETVSLISTRSREYFENYDGALQRSKTLVKEAERRGEHILCLIYRQTLVATVVESDRRHLRIVT
jgi:hypothetical protein